MSQSASVENVGSNPPSRADHVGAGDDRRRPARDHVGAESMSPACCRLRAPAGAGAPASALRRPWRAAHRPVASTSPAASSCSRTLVGAHMSSSSQNPTHSPRACSRPAVAGPATPRRTRSLRTILQPCAGPVDEVREGVGRAGPPSRRPRAPPSHARRPTCATARAGRRAGPTSGRSRLGDHHRRRRSGSPRRSASGSSTTALPAAAAARPGPGCRRRAGSDDGVGPDELLVAGAHPHADGVVAHVEDRRDHHRRPVGARLAVALRPLVDPRPRPPPARRARFWT